jgi:lysozyme family protein
MRSVREIASEIIAREGGFVDDPDDPGGATNFGVTIHTLRRLGLDKTGDGRVDVADVRALTRADATEIFIEHYFVRPRIGEMPVSLHPSLFDMYVNAGANAVKILQQLLRGMGQVVAVDGVIGAQTARAAHSVDPTVLPDAYAIARRNYYFRLADARPASRKYARTQNGGKGGWITRAEAFLDPKYHLSREEFQTRVEKWG